MESDVWTNFVQTFDFTVKALMISNSLNHRYFQMKTDMNVKIGSYTKLCMQNKIFASKMQNIKQQRTSVFAPLILKRWIFYNLKIVDFTTPLSVICCTSALLCCVSLTFALHCVIVRMQDIDRCNLQIF